MQIISIIKKTVKYEHTDCLQSFLERKMPNINGNKNEMKIAKYKLTRVIYIINLFTIINVDKYIIGVIDTDKPNISVSIR